VLYDCTLDPEFEASKAIQIENFCDQLKKGKIQYGGKEINIRDLRKSVWIVTKRPSRERTVRQIDDILVKEVPITKIIQLYRKTYQG